MLSIHFDSFPKIETARLNLREIVATDADTLFAIRTNPDVTKYLDRDVDKDVGAVSELIGEMRHSFEAGDGINWAITESSAGNGSDNGDLIGVIGFWRFDKMNHRAEIGYILHPNFWLQGLMTEAMEAVLKFGFQEIKLHSVEANTSVANLASQSLLLKCGFVQEAHFRENWHYNGTFYDSLIFCKLTDIK